MMIALAQADVLRALKRYRCLAKQDLVFCQYQDDPDFWRSYALARYNIYQWLERMVLTCGVNQTYLLAVERYAGLPLFISSSRDKGVKEALEVFFLFIAGESPMDAKVNA
ncbi:MAG: hypothetical protein ACOX46_05415 [Limnochordia bacterium]|nr:hypothetical protein [Bacillota bacterium]NLL07891.1 hypothetical protein [Bacillota bacterium]HBG08734.1 hypothetical protein [Bacillota bacterium]